MSAHNSLKKPTATLGVCVEGFRLLQLFNIYFNQAVQFYSLFTSFILNTIYVLPVNKINQNFGPSLMTQEHIIGSVIVSVDIIEHIDMFFISFLIFLVLEAFGTEQHLIFCSVSPPTNGLTAALFKAAPFCNIRKLENFFLKF